MARVLFVGTDERILPNLRARLEGLGHTMWAASNLNQLMEVCEREELEYVIIAAEIPEAEKRRIAHIVGALADHASLIEVHEGRPVLSSAGQSVFGDTDFDGIVSAIAAKPPKVSKWRSRPKRKKDFGT